MQDFLNVLRGLWGNNSPKESSELVNTFKYATKQDEEKAGKQLREGVKDTDFFWNKGLVWGGTDNAKQNVGAIYGTAKGDPSTIGNNSIEYVPFKYSAQGSPEKYGYIVRYMHGGLGWNEKIYGVITPEKEYSAEGAKDFFNRIVKSGGSVNLLSPNKKISDVGRSIRITKPETKFNPFENRWSTTVTRDVKYADPSANNAFRNGYDVIGVLRKINGHNADPGGMDEYYLSN